MIFGGYVKVNKPLYDQVIIWVIWMWRYLGMKVLAWYIVDPWSAIIKDLKFKIIPFWYPKMWNPYYRYPNDIKKIDGTNPTIVHTKYVHCFYTTWYEIFIKYFPSHFQENKLSLCYPSKSHITMYYHNLQFQNIECMKDPNWAIT